MNVIEFRRKLIAWWRVNHREFPWRKTRHPYKLLVAEVLLHRTRAPQVVPLYREFVHRYPSWASVARASLQHLRLLLRPLGLEWRTTQLHRMARVISLRFHGRTPTKRDDLESLPGVGHYTATAVRCFAYGAPEVLLDTNTVRVLSRVRGLRHTDASRRSRLYHDEMARLLDRGRPREFNFALLDLAALVCRPTHPECAICPILMYCLYGKRRLTGRKHT